MIAKASSPAIEQPRRRNASGGWIRDWEEYGPPPAPRPLRVPTRREVLEALRSGHPRRFTPSQERLLRRMVELTQDRGWCYFSTAGWVKHNSDERKDTGLPRTQLLRTKRELIDQQVIFYEPFPEEEAPYVTQVGNGWIGFRSTAEWLIPEKKWGGTRANAGRKRAGCNNLIPSQPSCDNLIAGQADCNNLIPSQPGCNNLIPQPGSQASCNNLKMTPAPSWAEPSEPAHTREGRGEIKLIQPTKIKLIQQNSSGAAPDQAREAALSWEEGGNGEEGGTYPSSLSNDSSEVAQQGAAPGESLGKSSEETETTAPSQSPITPATPLSTLTTDEETGPTAELVNTGEQRILNDEELDRWRQRLEQMNVAAKAMERGPERDAAFKVHQREWGEYLTAKRRAHPLPVQEERVPTSLELACRMLDRIKDRSKWPSANGYTSYIAPLEPVDFQDGCLLVRARGKFPADYFNRSLAYKALRLLSGYQVSAIQAIYDAPVEVEPDEEEEPAEEEAVPAPTSAALPTYANAGEYTNAMMGALIQAWGYEGQVLDDTTRGILAKVGAQLRQARIHPAYVPLFVGWVRRQHRLARPGQMQGLVPDFVKTHKGTPYDNYPPLEQLDWLPQVEKRASDRKASKGPQR